MQATIEDNILDVTLLEPRQKHPTIFARFDKLMEGESLTILNDHDPKPLYYQLLGERGNIFDWRYLEQGPEWWKVCIAKRNKNEVEETIGQIASKDLHKVRVFKKYGIDFCCGGKKTLREACAQKGIDVTKVEQELQNTDKALDIRALPFNDWSLSFLSDYIVNTHHTYVRKVSPELEFYSRKVAAVHGKEHPELLTIHNLVAKIVSEMNAHMIKEEKVVFPYVKSLENRSTDSGFAGAVQFDSINQPISVMEMEHDEVGKLVAQIKLLSNNYTLPEDACASYKILYDILAEFEEDLHVHIHLENNILFAKAAALENQTK